MPNLKTPSLWGIDYYPEHWGDEEMGRDMDTWCDMGCNVVRIGEFAWHLMEKEDGCFDFSYFDHVIRELKNRQLKVIFGTPTATFPAWLAQKHPSVFSMDEHLQTRAFGGRRQYCYNSEVYRKYSMRLVNALVEHYQSEEAIVAWQVDNEFGHENSDQCYCPTCQLAFQRFLQDKYINIQKLNEVYGTIFWGQTYNSFAEIPAPLKTITVHNPSLLLDWARFRSFSLNRYANEQIELVKTYRGEGQLVTTNLPGGFFSKQYDHVETCKGIDVVSYDNYPVWGGQKEPIEPAAIAMLLDFVRGVKHQNFWILEQLMGAQGHDVIGYLPRPNQAKMWSWQALARGCESLLFFRDRGMDRGAEQFCYGILDHDNKRGRKFAEARSFFEEAKSHEGLIQTDFEADVAVLYDRDNVWSWQNQRQSNGLDFEGELLRLYRPFYRRNIKTDVIPVDRPFEAYKVLVLPVLQIVDELLADRLKAFVAGGGIVLSSFRTGIRNKDNNLHRNLTAPCHVSDLFGIEIPEVESLLDGLSVPVSGVESFKPVCNQVYGQGYVWRDMIHPITARPLYTYDDAPYSHYACVTENDFGKGKAYYVGAGLDQKSMEVLVDHVIANTDLKPLHSDPGVEVVERIMRENGQEHKVQLVMNHGHEERTYGKHHLPAFGTLVLRQDEL